MVDGEALWVHRADDSRKVTAGDAYEGRGSEGDRRIEGDAESKSALELNPQITQITQKKNDRI